MKSDEFIKSIDGEMYYRYDYAYFLYKELQKRDKALSKAEKKITLLLNKIYKNKNYQVSKEELITLFKILDVKDNK